MTNKKESNYAQEVRENLLQKYHHSIDETRDPASCIIHLNNNQSRSRESVLASKTQLKKIQLVWRNLSFDVNEPSGNCFSSSKSVRTLIHNLNGSIKNGQLTAIIGPSGAGKTTLIECLAGRRARGLRGDISIKHTGTGKNSLKISYYCQHDSLNELLTVEESLSYALQLRQCQPEANSCLLEPNAKLHTAASHSSQVIQGLVEELNLKKCFRVSVSKCSGGQKRRLSIALELIFCPTIMLLDEPTSGLDSLSSLQCIMMLKKLASNEDRPMVIATSIHQPTAKIMSYFDQLYIISTNGLCIYNGPTEQLVSKLSSFGLDCPQYHNPADYVVEIASGDFGNDRISCLANHFKTICEEQSSDLNSNEDSKTLSIAKLVQNTQKHDFLVQLRATWVLTKRSMLLTFRNPNIYIARFIIIISTLILMGIIYRDQRIGTLDGCLSRPNMQTLKKLKNLDILSNENNYYANFGFLFYSVILTVFIAILPTLLSFPLEVSVFIKQNFNGWYSLKSYYLARNLAELPPILFFPILYGSVSFFLTHQFFEWSRFLMYLFILIVVASLAQGLGFIVSAYFVNNVTTSTVVGGIINIPLFLFTGLLIKISAMPSYFQPFTYLSYFRLAFESLLVTIYGMNRCQQVELVSFSYLKEEFGDNIIDMYVCLQQLSPLISDNVTMMMDTYNDRFLSSINQFSSSVALSWFNYSDHVLSFNLVAMALYAVVLRFAAFWVLHCKTTIK